MLAVPLDPSSASKKRWLFYWSCLFALCFLTILHVAFYYHGEVGRWCYVFSCLSIGGGVYAWCYFDAKARKFRFTQNMKMAVGLVGPIGVPYFFVCTRGFKAAARAGFGLFLYVPFYALYYVVWISTVRILQAAGVYG